MFEKYNHRNGRNVWVFFLLTFIYSWTLWLPFVLANLGIIKYSDTLAALMMPAVLLGAFAPLLAAVTIIAHRHGWSEVRKYIRQAFDLRIKARYFILAILVPVIVTVVAHYLAIFTGIDNLPKSFLPDNLPVPRIIAAIPYFLLMLIVGGGQEEFGWRGYAQEPLQERFGVLGGSLVLGIVWGFWHLPLWFTGDGHSYYPFLAFLIFTVSQSIIMGWVYNASGKKLVIPLLMHAVSNTVIPFFPIVHLENVPQPGYWLWGGINSVVALGLTIWFWRKNKVAAAKGNNQQYSLN